MGRLPTTALATLLAALALAGCATRTAVTAPAAVVDPYVDAPDGGARYAGDVNRPAAQGVLAGSATPQAFAAVAGDTVGFAEESVVLSAEAQAVVARQAAWLSRNAGFTALVEGHADEQGTREYNLALGARRAASVQEFLIARGIPAARVTTVSYGNERPRAACPSPADAACAAANRRAVTIVSPAAPVGAGV